MVMTEKRYTIKTQDDLFGVVDNYSADKVCVINGIRTEIEAEWLCKDMNTLNDENEQLKQSMDNLFDYFAKWFEEERGIYIEEFSEMWDTIKIGENE